LLEPDELGLCHRCQATLPWTEEGTDPGGVEGCQACLAPLWYRGQVPDGIDRYKFRFGRMHGVLFGRLMAQCLSDRWEEPVDFLTWVPLSPKGLRRRGYDQARLLAEQAGAELSLPVLSTLEKRRETRTQSRLRDHRQRWDNVKGAYGCLPGVKLSGETVVLVDDVRTSGATLTQCARCLREAGAGKIVALTLARAGK
jgi:ComF family protein